jgi:hypothetical protein
MIYFLSGTALAGNPSHLSLPAFRETLIAAGVAKRLRISFVAENIRMGGVVSTRQIGDGALRLRFPQDVLHVEMNERVGSIVIVGYGSPDAFQERFLPARFPVLHISLLAQRA